jgi:uncharacterized protein (UPF0335 family)
MVKFGGVSGDMLRQLVSKIEKLEEEKTEVQECIRDAFAEAKAQGFDVKALKKLLKERKMDRSELLEQEEILDIYRHALGMENSPMESPSESQTQTTTSSGEEASEDNEAEESEAA